MVQETQIINVDLDLSNPVFSYLSDKEVLKLFDDEKRLAQFEIYKNEKYKFTIIVEDNGENLHVRELAGNFMFEKKLLHALVTSLAKLLNKDKVTAVTKHDTLKKIYLSLGWEKFSMFDEYFYKVQ